MESAYQNTVDEVRNLKGIEEALALAIEREKEAKDFYMQQAAMMENPKFKELYEHLAGEEVKIWVISKNTAIKRTACYQYGSSQRAVFQP